MLHNLLVFLLHISVVIVIYFWFKYQEKRKLQRIKKAEEIFKKYKIAEKCLCDWKPDWILYNFLRCQLEKEVQKNSMRNDREFQRLLTEYFFAKLNYFESKGITFFQNELYELLEISTDERLTDKIYCYLIDKNSYYIMRKELENAI